MKKIKGEGRTRFGRFAALSIPATVVSAGLGVAIIQGSIGATLASANAFNLTSTQITSDSLKVAAGSASAGGTNHETIYAETGYDTKANGVHITAETPQLPIIGKCLSFKIDSTDPTIALPNVVLNAAQLGVADADGTTEGTSGSNAAAYLQNVQLGVSSATVGEGIKDDTNKDGVVNSSDSTDAGGFADNDSTTAGVQSGNQDYDGNAFALGAGQSTLNGVDADSYAITLGGLALDNLSLGVSGLSSC